MTSIIIVTPDVESAVSQCKDLVNYLLRDTGITCRSFNKLKLVLYTENCIIRYIPLSRGPAYFYGLSADVLIGMPNDHEAKHYIKITDKTRIVDSLTRCETIDLIIKYESYKPHTTNIYVFSKSTDDARLAIYDLFVEMTKLKIVVNQFDRSNLTLETDHCVVSYITNDNYIRKIANNGPDVIIGLPDDYQKNYKALLTTYPMYLDYTNYYDIISVIMKFEQEGK